MSWEILGLIIISLVIFYNWYTRDYNYWQKRGVQFERPIFPFGSIWRLLTLKYPISAIFAQTYFKYEGPYVGYYLLHHKALLLRCPKLINKILITDYIYFEHRGLPCDDIADDVMSKSLFFIAEGWKELKNKYYSIFTPLKIKNIFPKMTVAIKNARNYLDENQGIELDVRDCAFRMSVDLTATCILGEENNSFSSHVTDLLFYSRKIYNFRIYNVFRMIIYTWYPSFVPYLKISFFDSASMDYFKKILFENASHKQKHGVSQGDLTDYLFALKKEESETITREDIKNIVALTLSFSTASFESMSNALIYTFHELSVNEEIQEKARKEIRLHSKPNEEITYESLSNMQYLENIVSETFRKYPITAFLVRQCSKNYVIEETGLEIEKGTNVFVPLSGLHNDPKYFENPQQFNPDRFSKENIRDSINYNSYIPFGNGPRKCIGDRLSRIMIKFAVASLLKNYSFEKCPHTKPVVIDPIYLFARPKYPIYLNINKL